MVHPVFAVRWKLVSLVVCQYSASRFSLTHHVFLDRPVADVWPTLQKTATAVDGYVADIVKAATGSGRRATDTAKTVTDVDSLVTDV